MLGFFEYGGKGKFGVVKSCLNVWFVMIVWEKLEVCFIIREKLKDIRG